MNKILDLIDLKSIVTITLIVGTAVGFFQGKIESDQWNQLVMIVITFYFAKPTYTGGSNE